VDTRKSSDLVSAPPEAQSVQVVARAAAILRALASTPEGQSLAELASQVGLARSTVHRLVKALEQENFVVAVSASAGFRLGPGLLQLANASSGWVFAHVHGELVRLSNELEETVDLAVLSGNAATFIDQVAKPQRLQAVSAIGVSFPLHASANGKAILAELDDAEVRRLVGTRLSSLTPNTITSLKRLSTEIETVRTTKLAWDLEEHDIGICAIGTAIPGALGVLSAISVPIPASRFYGREKLLAAKILAARARIESQVSL
jgi:DNA-binding IclR family transcriptional regulator